MCIYMYTCVYTYSFELTAHMHKWAQIISVQFGEFSQTRQHPDPKTEHPSPAEARIHVPISHYPPPVGSHYFDF